MTTVTVTTGIDRASRLIPFHATHLRGDYGAVLSFAGDMPEQLREAQQRRRETYMTTGSRTEPADAPRYFVTSYGTLIAWVTLDGQTHFATLIPSGRNPRTGALVDTPRDRAMQRHQEAIRAAWPQRFTMNGMGDPRI
jgi:hypothetical protein